MHELYGICLMIAMGIQMQTICIRFLFVIMMNKNVWTHEKEKKKNIPVKVTIMIHRFNRPS